MDKKDEISELKNELTGLHSEKEKLMQQKNDLQKTTSDLVVQAKDMKKKKDEFNLKLNELKKERDQHNSKVREFVSKIKEIQKKKLDLYKKLGIKVDPDQIQDQINKMQMKIETEVVSFNKEKEMMFQIRKLEKQYEESKVVKFINEFIKI